MKNFPFEGLKSSALQLGDRLGNAVRSWRAFPLTGILALLGFVVPAQIAHAGICELCEARPHLCSPETLASCKPCDEKLLKELKAKRDQKIKAYREIVAAAEETRQREAEALAEAQKIFGDYAKGVAEKGVVKVGKEVFKVPDEVVAAYKEAKITNSDKAASEKFLKLTKMYLEELFKHAGYKTAVTRAKWIDAAMSGALMDAMVLTKLKEAEFHAEQAYNQWLRGYEALMEARHLEDRIRKLEAQCKEKSAPPPPPEQEADERSSGERDAEAAQKMLDGWKTVESGFEDSEGNFHEADFAFEEALAIVQSQQSHRLDAIRWLASFGFPARPVLVKDMTEAELDAEWNKFRVPLRQAFELVIKGMEGYHRAEQQFYMLGGSPAPSGQQPAQSGKPKTSTCIGMGCGETAPKCVGMGCEKESAVSKKKPLSVQVHLSLAGIKNLQPKNRIQFEEIKLQASVTDLPANSSPPLYKFVTYNENGVGLGSSGEFAPNPEWTWPQNNSNALGQLVTFAVTVKISPTQGTREQTAKIGPYLVVSDAKARWGFENLIYPVMTYARCLNCHVSGESPTQGDDRHLHVPSINRQTDCSQCHGTQNGAAPGSPPGAPGWGMPPFSFVNKSASQLCRQIKDPTQNGGRTLEQLEEHVRNDLVILWAWNPGPGRTPPPRTWENFAIDGAFPQWIKNGAACPESEKSRRK